MYLQSAVDTIIIWPFSMNIGTLTEAPPSTMAGFVPPAALFPLKFGGVKSAEYSLTKKNGEILDIVEYRFIF